MLVVEVPKKVTGRKIRLVQCRLQEDLYKAMAKRLPKGVTVATAISRLVEHVQANGLVSFKLEGHSDEPARAVE